MSTPPTKLIKILLLLVLLTPLFLISSFEMPNIQYGLIEGKRLYLIAYTMAIFLLHIIYLVAHKSITLQFNVLDSFLFAFGIYLVMNSYFKNGVILNTELLMWVACLFLYGWFKFILVTYNYAIYLLIALLQCSVIIQGVIGFLQLHGFQSSHHYLGITGGFFNPSQYAGFLVASSPLSLALFLDKQRTYTPIKYLSRATLFSVLLILPATWSRAAWLGALVGFAFVLFYHKQTHSIVSNILSKIRKQKSMIFFVLIISGLLFAGLYSFKKDSADGRILNWKVSFSAFLAQPLTGVGLGQFRPVFGDHQATYFKEEITTDHERAVAGKGEYAFNEFVRLLVEQGTIGFLLLLLGPTWLIFKICRDPTKRTNTIFIGLISSLATVFTFAFFSYPFSMAPNLLLFFLLLALLSSLKPGNKTNIKTPVFVKYPSFVIGCCLLYSLTQHVHSIYFSYEKWKQASVLKMYYDYSSALSIMKEVYPALDKNGDFLFEYGQTLKLNREYKKAITLLQMAANYTSDPYLYNALGDCYKELKQYSEAEKAYWHSYYLIPHKFYPLYLLTKLYQETGDQEKTLLVSTLFLEQKIKIPSAAINEMRVEINRVVEEISKSIVNKPSSSVLLDNK